MTPEESNRSLSAIQIDALREVGNIGAGNAAIALSQIVDKKVDLSVPKAILLPWTRRSTCRFPRRYCFRS